MTFNPSSEDRRARFFARQLLHGMHVGMGMHVPLVFSHSREQNRTPSLLKTSQRAISTPLFTYKELVTLKERE